MSLLFRQPRTSQPQGPVGIDWGNPITRGLLSALLPNNLATKTKSGGSVPLRVAQQGIVALGGSSALAYDTTASIGSTATIFMLGNMVGQSGSAANLAGIGTTSGGSQLFIFQGAQIAGATGARGVLRLVNAGGITSVESASLGGSGTTSAIEAWCCVYDGTTALKLYRNGVDDTGGNANVGASGAATSLNAPCINGKFNSAVAYAPSGSQQALVLAFNRALTVADIKSLSANPWQIFTPQFRQIWVPASVSIYRPSSDVLTTGWTGTPDNTDLYKNIDEVTASDTDYITSPTITGGESTIMGLSGSLVAGTWDVRYRANFTGTSADVRITLLDGSNVSQGVSSWQTVTSSYADYTAQITTTGTATRVMIEVQ